MKVMAVMLTLSDTSALLLLFYDFCHLSLFKPGKEHMRVEDQVRCSTNMQTDPDAKRNLSKQEDKRTTFTIKPS